MIKDYDEFKLLLDCYEVLDKFTRTSTCWTLGPLELSSLIVLLDILKPHLKDLH